MMYDLGLQEVYEIVSEQPEICLFCGKPEKFKNYEDNIGKKIEINGKPCIISYPLHYLVTKGESYTKRIYYTIEVLKNELLFLGKIQYREGKIISSS